MLKGGLVSIWELDVNLVPTLLPTCHKYQSKKPGNDKKRGGKFCLVVLAFCLMRI